MIFMEEKRENKIESMNEKCKEMSTVTEVIQNASEGKLTWIHMDGNCKYLENIN